MNSFSILVSAKKIILGEDVMIARNAVVLTVIFMSLNTMKIK